MASNDPDIDLITADVRLMPGDGVDAVEAICAKRNLPVLFITGYREQLEERKPGAHVLEKPIKPDELAAAVRNLLAEAPEESAKLDLQAAARTKPPGPFSTHS